ncbi:hypothetical protein GFC01_10815 [Desulfofundulus thermobenzoicus]|uniref:Uncharacterized protein n=1 Tax=Desulfofundulus thermobenzoicus TaxID=29376 RepID=A0A6N7IRJ3_9FIRM|nr:hypothetical protein [Desulfofundulus thermobenzoicus]MQL52745.1 hypothetical protein [Desulfofundulus thermobenzoicus]
MTKYQKECSANAKQCYNDTHKYKREVDKSEYNMEKRYDYLINKWFHIIYYIFVLVFVWHFAILPEKWFMWLLRIELVVGSLMAIYGTVTNNYITRTYIGDFVLTGLFLTTCLLMLIS